MSKDLNQTTHRAGLWARPGLSKFAAAAVMYGSFAVYLYQPCFKNFDKFQYLLVVNVCLASLGCFVLSRRWVVCFAGSFFAGAIYGFGPFVLGLAGYHPTAGFLAATVPWLFWPARLGFNRKWRWLRWPLSTLPFLAILLYFQLLAHLRLFIIPIQAKLHLADLLSLPVPLVMAKQSLVLVGFYHIPIAPLIIGLAMLLAARRFSVMVVFAIGMILAFCHSFLNTSPIIWLAIPTLCCSILIGVGICGLASAGRADRKWVLVTSIIMMILAVVTLLLATKYFQVFLGFGSSYARVFTDTGKMYILGAVTTAIIFFMAGAKLRVRWLRLVLLSSAMAVDIFLGARFIVDTIF